MLEESSFYNIPEIVNNLRSKNYTNAQKLILKTKLPGFESLSQLISRLYLDDIQKPSIENTESIYDILINHHFKFKNISEINFTDFFK